MLWASLDALGVGKPYYMLTVELWEEKHCAIRRAPWLKVLTTNVSSYHRRRELTPKAIEQCPHICSSMHTPIHVTHIHRLVHMMKRKHIAQRCRFRLSHKLVCVNHKPQAEHREHTPWVHRVTLCRGWLAVEQGKGHWPPEKSLRALLTGVPI